MQQKVHLNLQRSYDFLVHGDYDSNSSSFIKNINHLKAAHYFYFDLDKKLASRPIRWWKPNISTNNKISFQEASLKLRELFIKSVKLHLRSDVPIGIALSGGLDSSSIASVVKYIDPHIKFKTFSFISDDKKISEEKWVDYLNSKLNYNSQKVRLKSKDLKVEIKDLCAKQEEPFGGTSVYAQYKIFSKVKQTGVRVMIEGQGADELLAGYLGYPGYRILSLLESKGLNAAHKFVKNWSKSFQKSYFIPWFYLFRIILPDQIYKNIRLLLGRNFKPSWLKNNFLKNKYIFLNEKRSKLEKKNHGNRVKEAMLRSITDRGLQTMLRHGDRNSMAFSIESRVPFLTIPLAEFLFSLPENYLISDKGLTKNIFRTAMRGIVPNKILERRDKIGFETNEKKLLSLEMINLKKWIYNAKFPSFIDKTKFIKEIYKTSSLIKTNNARIWRMINYIYWYNYITNEKKIN